MTPERYHKIGELFHVALELEAEARTAFLERACQGDAELRGEVESLLRSHEEGEGVVDEPALDVAAGLLASDLTEQIVGQTLAGRYRVLSLLGTGGMGRVYLAEDAGLSRRVALKFLPEHLTHDAEQVRRFRQEARAASALNHPNIITVYGIEETGDTSIIASEYIEGETLRKRLSRGALPPAEALDIAAQIASALRAAHEAGIVHRDVKPENVMLRPDGYVKVLDFGIAKLAPRRTNAAEEAGQNGSTVKTTPGLIMGTDRYMSPEQARGQEVDARSDVWSLGCVLYEMLAGVPPFTGETASDVVAAVLKTEPAPLPQVAKNIPAELQRIVRRCLEKEREARYPSAAELFDDLRRLQKRLQALDDGGWRTRRFGLTAPPGALLHSRRRKAVALAALLLVATLTSVLFFSRRAAPAPRPEVKSLAVLPLKSLNREAGDNYLGLGIADTIITKVSQAGGLTVRPTSAVRRYAEEEMDSLEAARQLQADAVLDGTFLHAGERLRVSVNLLRTSDGASLWAESFDVRFTDIFAIQDDVSKQVAARLRLKLDPAEQARLAKRHTANPEAYNYYTKAMYHFGKRDRSFKSQDEAEIAIDLFKKAVELDPNYALAHAQLGYANAWVGDFKRGKVPGLIVNAKEELRVAERLDPQLAEVHVARSFILWSWYGGWQTEAALREARMAKELDPNADNLPLPVLYFHMGLEDRGAEEFERALARDPTSDIVKNFYCEQYSLNAMPDEWLALYHRLFNAEPKLLQWYYLGKRMAKEAAPLVEQNYAKSPDDFVWGDARVLLLALQGRHREAQAAGLRLVEKVPKDKYYHHATYDLARVYALDGNSAEALKWLRATAEAGFPCYTLFARDAYLDPIRQDPAFVQFMAEMKNRWEGYRREFG